MSDMVVRTYGIFVIRRASWYSRRVNIDHMLAGWQSRPVVTGVERNPGAEKANSWLVEHQEATAGVPATRGRPAARMTRPRTRPLAPSSLTPSAVQPEASAESSLTRVRVRHPSRRPNSLRQQHGITRGVRGGRESASAGRYLCPLLPTHQHLRPQTSETGPTGFRWRSTAPVGPIGHWRRSRLP
jgi:hypothetical protein